MRDGWIGVQRARPIGQMLTGQEGSYTSPARYCETCGAKLRTRNHGQHCAPCEEARATPPPPTDETSRCACCERAYTPWRSDQKYCSMTCSQHRQQATAKMRRTSRGTAA